MFNKIILIGNLTKDPELRYTPQGTPVASFRLAVTLKHRPSGDETKEETLFINVVVFGKQAEAVSQYLSKGRSVLVDGRLQEQRWESDGQQRSKFEVIAQTVKFLPRRTEAAPQQDTSPPPEEITDIEPF